MLKSLKVANTDYSELLPFSGVTIFRLLKGHCLSLYAQQILTSKVDLPKHTSLKNQKCIPLM